MSKQNSKSASYGIEIQRPRSFITSNLCLRMDDSEMVDPVTILGSTASMWLLSIICSSHPSNRLVVMEGNGLEIIAENLQRNKSNTQVNKYTYLLSLAFSSKSCKCWFC
jgi:hypothetical protein